MQQEFQDCYDAEYDIINMWASFEHEQSDGKLVQPPAPYLKYQDYKSFARGQINFTKAFVLPTWTKIATLLPWMQFCVDRIHENIKIYEYQENPEKKLGPFK